MRTWIANRRGISTKEQEEFMLRLGLTIAVYEEYPCSSSRYVSPMWALSSVVFNLQIWLYLLVPKHPNISFIILRITAVIADLDLKNLIDNVNKKFQANEKWEDVINRRTDRLSYYAQCCKLKVPAQILSLCIVFLLLCGLRIQNIKYILCLMAEPINNLNL